MSNGNAGPALAKAHPNDLEVADIITFHSIRPITANSSSSSSGSISTLAEVEVDLQLRDGTVLPRTKLLLHILQAAIWFDGYNPDNRPRLVRVGWAIDLSKQVIACWVPSS